MAPRVMIAAGGTGGHVFPALAVAQELQERGSEVIWMGTRRGLEARIVTASGIPMEWIRVTGFRGKGPGSKGIAMGAFVWGCLQAGWVLLRRRPKVMLGMGGFVAAPGGLMAGVMGIPLVIHEQNRIPGTTNRWLAWLADRVLEAFPGTFADDPKVQCTGNPLRKEIARLAKAQKQLRAADGIRLLVLGGSQGARILNQIVPRAIELSGRRFVVFHQTGVAGREDVCEAYRGVPAEVRVEAFIDDMAAAYGWADLVICRAGAMTVSELAAAGLPAILVPYPHAIDDHQTLNARFLEGVGAAVLVPEDRLNPESLAGQLRTILNDTDRLRAMSAAARSVARPEATRQVAEICLQAGKR